MRDRIPAAWVSAPARRSPTTIAGVSPIRSTDSSSRCICNRTSDASNSSPHLRSPLCLRTIRYKVVAGMTVDADIESALTRPIELAAQLRLNLADGIIPAGPLALEFEQRQQNYLALAFIDFGSVR